MRFVALVLFAAAAATVLYFRNPAVPGSYGYCPLRALTGLHCPGCGGLRGLNRLLHGDVRGALAMNPLMVLSLPFAWAAFVCYAVRVWRPNPRPLRPLPRSVAWAVLSVFILYGALRNIPVAPFTYLAPHVP